MGTNEATVGYISEGSFFNCLDWAAGLPAIKTYARSKTNGWPTQSYRHRPLSATHVLHIHPLLMGCPHHSSKGISEGPGVGRCSHFLAFAQDRTGEAGPTVGCPTLGPACGPELFGICA